jgi:hypothetical protein
MLYDTIENLDTAILKLNYILQAHRAYTGELLEDYWNDKGIILNTLNGIDSTNNDIVKEFEEIAQSFTKIMKKERGLK